VDEEFARWPANQPDEWKPKTIGSVDQRYIKGLLQGPTSFPNRVYVYYDRKDAFEFQLAIFLGTNGPNLIVYVSAVWNSYRKCRLCLLNLIYTCSQQLQDENDFEKSSSSTVSILKAALALSEDIAASIPFHLTRNPEIFFFKQQQKSSIAIERQTIVANRSVGGLLLMHPIYVVSALSVVPTHLRSMFREYLAFIGRVMGVGQARLLADVSTCLL
jgi:hypothetical protein